MLKNCLKTTAPSCFRGFLSTFLAHFLDKSYSKHRKNDQKTIKKRLKNDETKNLGPLVAPVHKNTNVPLILIVWEVIFCMLEKHIIGLIFEGASTFLTPKLSLAALWTI